MLSSYHSYTRSQSAERIHRGQMMSTASDNSFVGWLASFFSRRMNSAEGFERNITHSREWKRPLPRLDLTHKQIFLIGNESDQVKEVESFINQFGGRSTKFDPTVGFGPSLAQARIQSATFFIFLDNFPLVDFKPLQLIAKINSQLPESSLYLLTAAVRYSDTKMGHLGGSDGIIQLPIDPIELAIVLE